MIELCCGCPVEVDQSETQCARFAVSDQTTNISRQEHEIIFPCFPMSFFFGNKLDATPESIQKDDYSKFSFYRLRSISKSSNIIYPFLSSTLNSILFLHATLLPVPRATIIQASRQSHFIHLPYLPLTLQFLMFQIRPFRQIRFQASWAIGLYIKMRNTHR